MTIAALGLQLVPQAAFSNSWSPWQRFYVTGYDLSGTTASGSPVYYGEVAVDPHQIPLGSTVQIKHLGTFKALDTGGDIVGHRLDVWEPTLARCYAITGSYLARWRR